MRALWRMVRGADYLARGFGGVSQKVYEAMRRLIILTFALTSCAFAQDATDDEGMVLTPAEHRVLAQRMLDLQNQIDDLTEQLSKAKEKFNVGHNCS